MRYLFEFTPKMSWRSIGDKPEVGFHHDKVGKVQDAAKAVLGLTRRELMIGPAHRRSAEFAAALLCGDICSAIAAATGLNKASNQSGVTVAQAPIAAVAFWANTSSQRGITPDGTLGRFRGSS